MKKDLPIKYKKKLGYLLEKLKIQVLDCDLDDGTGGWLVLDDLLAGQPVGLYDWQVDYNVDDETTKFSYQFDQSYTITSDKDVRVSTALNIDFKDWLKKKIKNLNLEE